TTLVVASLVGQTLEDGDGLPVSDDHLTGSAKEILRSRQLQQRLGHSGPPAGLLRHFVRQLPPQNQRLVSILACLLGTSFGEGHFRQSRKNLSKPAAQLAVIRPSVAQCAIQAGSSIQRRTACLP